MNSCGIRSGTPGSRPVEASDRDNDGAEDLHRVASVMHAIAVPHRRMA